MTIYGVTDTKDIKEQFGSGYYPNLKEREYPKQINEAIINGLSDYFNKCKNPAFLSRKSIILSKGKGWRGNNSIGQKI